MRRLTHSVPVGPSETDVMLVEHAELGALDAQRVAARGGRHGGAGVEWMLVMDGRAVEVAGATERNPATVSLHCTRMPTGPAGVRHAIRLCA